MKTITVTASKKYDVIIGSGILSQLEQYVPKIKKACKTVIISDTNVSALYIENVSAALRTMGYDTSTYVFSAGEESKNGKTYLDILDFLARNKLTRSDLLVALGGGVVGDMTGFVAATYLRGISFIQIPTSLLAMVDSSVGGKTAIDLPSGKNLAGAFYQPALVLCDTDTLASLPDDFFRDGCAEVIKYGILYDEALFAHLDQHGLDFDREYVIARCVELKRDVVCEDEFDTGNRQKLNLGHTIGHGIEAESRYTIPHGHAVSAGIAIISKAAVKMDHLSETAYTSIIATLKKFALPTKTACTADMLLPYVLGDKKREGASINLVIPHRIGDCQIHATPILELKSIIEAGL